MDDAGNDGKGLATVLVGLDAAQLNGDRSHASLHAAAYASGLAHRQGGRVVAVWVRPPIPIADGFAETVEHIGRQREQREAEVRAAAQQLGVAAHGLLVRDGDPFEELTAVAAEIEADTIVVGASTQRLGSLAVRLIRDGRWPVTVVP